jgi:D-lactate dehydrogenase (cytochrome)
MQVKTQQDEFQSYLKDASNIAGGYAEKIFIPEDEKEISEILAEANARRISVTISGARTGTVGGAIPFGGYVISMEKLNKVKEIDKSGHFAVVQGGVILNDLQRLVESENLFYPPDPTEWSCQIGGNIATNASGARSFKYGATRKYVRALKVILPNGETLDLRRGKIVSENGYLELQTMQGSLIKVKLPTYRQPNVRKNTTGYFSGDKVDAVDIFIGSEGTLGVIVEAELELLPKPESFFSGIVFFEDESNLLRFVFEARERSFRSREEKNVNEIDATLLEYFDSQSLRFISEKFPETPQTPTSAIFFEQETTEDNENILLEKWNALLEKHNAGLEISWFTTNEQDRERMRRFRHALPVAVNERIARYNQRKIGTDMAVPDENFLSFLRFYKTKLDESGIDYVIFGHIGDSHLHANLLPKNEEEAIRSRHLYGRFIAQAIMLGGTVSAEHGIGKHKRKYLYVQLGERYLNEMITVKKAFDPKLILGRGNLFDLKFLE